MSIHDNPNRYTLAQFREACSLGVIRSAVKGFPYAREMREQVAARLWQAIEAALLAATPQAKTCEPECCKVFATGPHAIHRHIGCTPECETHGRPMNPAPDASPPALPCPVVGCDCRDRAKAVPRDSAKDSTPGGVPPVQAEKPTEQSRPSVNGGSPPGSGGGAGGDSFLSACSFCGYNKGARFGNGEPCADRLMVGEMSSICLSCAALACEFMDADGSARAKLDAKDSAAPVRKEPNPPLPDDAPTSTETKAGGPQSAEVSTGSGGGGQPGVPEGWRLGDGWRMSPDNRWSCWFGLGSRGCTTKGSFIRKFIGACSAHAVQMRAIVPFPPDDLEVIECTSGNFRYRYMRFVGDVQQGSNDKVNWVQTRPDPIVPPAPKRAIDNPDGGYARGVADWIRRGTAYLKAEVDKGARSEPDEAPLSPVAARIHDAWFNGLSINGVALRELRDEVAALETKLAAVARQDAIHAKEAAEILAECRELRAQLAAAEGLATARLEEILRAVARRDDAERARAECERQFQAKVAEVAQLLDEPSTVRAKLAEAERDLENIRAAFGSMVAARDAQVADLEREAKESERIRVVWEERAEYSQRRENQAVLADRKREGERQQAAVLAERERVIEAVVAEFEVFKLKPHGRSMFDVADIRAAGNRASGASAPTVER